MKIFFLAGFIFMAGMTQAQDSTKIKETAGSVLKMLQNHKMNDAYALFDNKIQSAMRPNNLSSIWNGIIAQNGALKEVKAIWVKEVPDYKIVVQECLFGQTLLDFELTFDEQGKVAGIFFAPKQGKNQ